jgi:hypothetical protein
MIRAGEEQRVWHEGQTGGAGKLGPTGLNGAHAAPRLMKTKLVTISTVLARAAVV